LGVAFGNLVRGVPIDANMQYVGGFFNLLNPYALLSGATTVAVFTLYGALFLGLKTDGELREAARRMALRLWPAAVAILVLFLAATYFATDILARFGVNPGIVPLAGTAAALLAGYFIRKRMQAACLHQCDDCLALVTMFMILFCVMVSAA
jgi:cytochrome d ubiquinol oxidase subunit II